MKNEFNFPSCDGIHTLSGTVYLPEGEAKAFFHIVHGMTEHIGRYDRIMQDLAKEGYICFGYDNLGHGNTAKNSEELGFIAEKDGDALLCRDVKAFSDAVMAEYSEKYGKLPYFLMGHSMGSFITRMAVEKYVTPEKYIIMGTGGRNPAAGAGLALIAMIRAIRGDHHVSKMIDKIAFGSYNKRFGGGTKDDPSPWLTSDIEARKRYYADPFCTFKFTVSAMGNLIRLIKTSNRADWFKNVPRNMQILLLSGEDDPVGDYGKGVKQVFEGLKNSGHDAKCILYPGARHEILNDVTYDKVKSDIIEFFEI